MDKLGEPADLTTAAADPGSSRNISVEGNAVGAALIAGDNNVVTIVYGAEAAWKHLPGAAEGAAEYVRQVRIFLSSPGDVLYERQLAREVAKELVAEPFLRDRAMLTIISWDDPDGPVPLLANITPQESVNQGRPRPSECDIVVVILWSRMGTPLLDKYRKPDGGRYFSGTEWEYEDALKPTPRPDLLVYRRTEKILLDADDPHLAAKLDQREKVKRFFERFCDPDGSLRGGVTDYDTPTTFAERLKMDLRERVAAILSRPSTPSRDAIAVAKTVVVRPWIDSPYPGLRPFASEETGIFFGRGREVDAMLTRLRNPGQRFLAVVGASGSGKSSVVHAGLLPRLSEGVIEGSEHWPLLAFTPGAYGDNALLALASKLEAVLPTRFRRPPAEIATLLAATPRQLLNYADALVAGRPPGTPLVLVIDQFEELFTVTAEKHRRHFLALLAECSHDPRILLIATLRADFLPQFVAEPALTAHLRENTFVLGEPGPAALLEMIRKPAERAGLELEEGLADEILRDLGGDPGALPLLAFALEELYRRASPRLTIPKFRDMGGVTGAIGRRAVELLKMVGKGEDARVQGILPDVFRALVYVDAAGKAARRRANLEELLAAPAPIPELIKMLIDPGRLLLAEDVGGRPTVILAHEALLQQWPTLSEWLESNRIQMQRIQRALSSLSSLEPRDRRWAVDTLLEVRPVTLEVVQALINLLEHEHEVVRGSAAQALGRIRPVAPAVIQALMSAQHDKYPLVRKLVIQAIGQIGPASAASTIAEVERGLIAALRDHDAPVRQAAAEALGRFGQLAKAAISALEEADRDEQDPVIGGMIRVALMRIKENRA